MAVLRSVGLSARWPCDVPSSYNNRRGPFGLFDRIDPTSTAGMAQTGPLKVVHRGNRREAGKLGACQKAFASPLSLAWNNAQW